MKSDSEHRVSPNTHKSNSHQYQQKSNTNSHAILPRQFIQNEIKQLSKKMKSPSPQVKFAFE